jgi:hypothetical protein
LPPDATKMGPPLEGFFEPVGCPGGSDVFVGTGCQICYTSPDHDVDEYMRYRPRCSDGEAIDYNSRYTGDVAGVRRCCEGGGWGGHGV